MHKSFVRCCCEGGVEEAVWNEFVRVAEAEGGGW